MDERHRSVLKRNRVKIIENIANPIDVSEALYANGVFTDSMKQEVEAEKTPFSKVRKILDIVPRRGQHAFDKFHEALVYTDNITVADIIKPELAGTHAPASGRIGFATSVEETELPATWPSEEDMVQPVQVKPCDVRSHLVTTKWLSNDVYSMKKLKRGRCVIISNQVFNGPLKRDTHGILRCILPARQGTAKDVKDLTSLFQQLHFTVQEHNERTAQQIDELLKSEARHSDHKDADCFILIICSHGTSKGIYGVDGKVITYEEIGAIFNAQSCPNLATKPKIIFLQACHGEKTDKGGVRSSNATDAVTFENEDDDLTTVGIEENLGQLQLNEEESDQGQGDQERNNAEDTTDAERIICIPTNTDFLVARATHPGYVSFRNTVYGSWFIQAVVWVFQRYAWDRDILQLLTLVNRLVAKGRTSDKNSQEVMQAARFDSSLEKLFYFFPGVIASES